MIKLFTKKPKWIGNSMAVCTGANSNSGGSLRVGTLDGNIICEIDNGFKFVMRMVISKDDVPAYVAALKNNWRLHRSAGSGNSMILKNMADIAPEQGSNEALQAVLMSDNREARGTTMYTPHCCAAASQAFLHAKSFPSVFVHSSGSYSPNPLAWLHISTGQPEQFAKLLERAAEGKV